MLSLLLLHHALAPGSIDAHARSRLQVNPQDRPLTDVESRPYLRVASMLPLRIKAAPPPPDLSSKPAAGAPPQPITNVPSDSGSSPVHTSTEPANLAGNTTPVQPDAVIPVTTPANPPPAILPDDTHPSTRPEDFLPFFQFPGPNHDVTIVVPVTPTRPPAPGQQPPSSATYQQK